MLFPVSKNVILGLAFLVVPIGARADFRLPIVGRVQKTISVPADIEPSFLEQFAGLSDLKIEIRHTRNNQLPPKLAKLLQSTFSGTRKLVWTSGEIGAVEIGEISGLRPVEIWHRVEGAELSAREINQLYNLGPVRKVIFLAGAFSHQLLETARRVRNSALAFEGQHLDAERIGWLCEERKLRKQVLLMEPKPELILDLTVVSPLKLVVHTHQNRLPAELVGVLEQLRGVEITLVVDGRLTVEDLKTLIGVENFELKIFFENPPQLIPGLASLLQQLDK